MGEGGLRKGVLRLVEVTKLGSLVLCAPSLNEFQYANSVYHWHTMLNVNSVYKL